MERCVKDKIYVTRYSVNGSFGTPLYLLCVKKYANGKNFFEPFEKPMDEDKIISYVENNYKSTVDLQVLRKVSRSDMVVIACSYYD